MTTDREIARLRTAYADLLDAESSPELARFCGELESLYTAPEIPARSPCFDLTGRAVANKQSDHERARTRPSALPGWVRSPFPPSKSPAWLARLNGAATIVSTAVLVVGAVAVAALLFVKRPDATTTGLGTPSNETPTLLYAGSLAGHTGIIAATIGGRERLLVEGNFFGVSPSPDGQRFLAYGTTEGTVTALVRLYATDGRLLRTYTLGATQPLIAYWAPNGQTLALFARAGTAAVWEHGNFQTWLLDDTGAKELQLAGQTLVGTAYATGVWSAHSRLLVGVIGADTNGDGQIGSGDAFTVWSVNADGGDPRPRYSGPGMPLGWSYTGTFFYVIESTRVLAIDDRTGGQRIVVTAPDARQPLGATPNTNGKAPNPVTFGLFQASALAAAPIGDRLALWLVPASEAPNTATAPPMLVVVDGQGREVGQDSAPTGATPRFTAWAPNAERLAYSYTTTSNDPAGIRAISIAIDGTVTVTDLGQTGTPPDLNGLRWSTDSTLMAFLSAGRVTATTADTPVALWTSKGTGTGWPSWQPAGNP